MPSSIRRDYVTTGSLKAGNAGGMNCGVYMVKSKTYGKTYIEKRLAPRYMQRGQAQMEVAAMRQCQDHPSIIRLQDWILDPQETGYGSIYMQYCELGSIEMLIEEYHKRGALLPDEGFLWQLFWDMSLALCYLYHGTDVKAVQKYCERGLPAPERTGWNRIVHRDIKPDNLFLTWDKTRTGYPTVVLADFGLCVMQDDVCAGREHATLFTGGTHSFKPPESPHYGAYSDIYQLGTVLHCVARMRSDPFESRTEREQYPLPSKLNSPPLLRLVQRCLRRDGYTRPVQKDLPLLVHEAYKLWAKGRKEGGKKLPSWALPGSPKKYY